MTRGEDMGNKCAQSSEKSILNPCLLQIYSVRTSSKIIILLCMFHSTPTNKSMHCPVDSILKQLSL